MTFHAPTEISVGALPNTNAKEPRCEFTNFFAFSYPPQVDIRAGIVYNISDISQ